MSARTLSFQKAFRWTFDSRLTGRVTVAQFPNVWVWIFLAAMLGERLVPPSSPSRQVLVGAKAASLTIWALDEIARGVNPWRRFLGVAALVYEAAFWLPR